RLRGILDVALFARSLDKIIQRHEALRTVFGLQNGEPVQQMVPTTVRLSVIDLQTLFAPIQSAELQRLALHEAQLLFDLSQGPLFRTTLLRFQEQEHVLLLTFQHLIADGWSIGVFVRELLEVYAASLQQRTPALPVLPFQYADYALWQRQWLQGEVSSRQLEYWKKQLAGAPEALNLPLDHPRPPVQIYQGAHLP